MAETKPLNDIEQKFVQLYDGDLARTANACGISERDAASLIRRIHVIDAIRCRDAANSKGRTERAILSREQMLGILSEVAEGKVKNGNGVEELVPLDVRMDALEMIGKATGQFSERRVHTGADGGAIQMEVTPKANEIDVTERAKAIRDRSKQKVIEAEIVQEGDASFLE